MMALACYLPILVLLLGVSCGHADSGEAGGDIQGPMQTRTLKRIREESGLDLSAKSKLVHFVEPERIVDPVWVAKVIIPASSYESLKGIVLGKTDDTTMYHGALADSTSWWKPTNVVLKKQYLADRHTLVSVVLSKEDVDYVLYIECAVF